MIALGGNSPRLSGEEPLVPLRSICDWLGHCHLTVYYRNKRQVTEVIFKSRTAIITESDCNVRGVVGGITGLPVPPELYKGTLYVHPKLFELLGCKVEIDREGGTITISHDDVCGLIKFQPASR